MSSKKQSNGKTAAKETQPQTNADARQSDEKFCNPKNCPHNQALLKAIRSRGELDSDVDREHLKYKHLPPFASYLEMEADHYYDQAQKLQAELDDATKLNEELRAKVRDLKKSTPQPSAWSGQAAGAKKVHVDEQLEKVKVDPRCHIDGFCDAIIKGTDGSIGKCRSYSDFEERTCARHADWKYLVDKPKSN